MDGVQKSKAQGMARKAGLFARVSDSILVIVFAYLAFTSEGGWAVFWAACSVFCLFTAITNPLEKIPAFISRVMGVKKA